jgi:hypothetical protein
MKTFINNETLPATTQVRLEFTRLVQGIGLHNGEVLVMAVDSENVRTPLVTIFEDGSIGRWCVSEDRANKLGVKTIGKGGRLADHWPDTLFSF